MKFSPIIKKTYLFLFFSWVFLISCDHNAMKVSLSRYPDGKNFAFTITEDPDYGTLSQKKIIYSFLDSLGLKTTIAVWVMDNKNGSGNKLSRTNTRGVSTTDSAYLTFLKQFQEKGFEICLHTVSPGNDYREETQAGYELFKSQFGAYPLININHADNLENIYWGTNRFSNNILRTLYGLSNKIDFQGEKNNSRYFWGDICREKTKYVRAWATDNINTIAVNSTMPYHEEKKPYVNWWFGCSDGRDCSKFKKLLSDKNIKRLNHERGTSIVYTHFAYGFINDNGILDQEVKNQLKKISALDGWFAPASTILNRFIQMRAIEVLYKNHNVRIVNPSHDTLKGLTIISPRKKWFLLNSNQWSTTNDENELILGDLPPNSIVLLSQTSEEPIAESPSFKEKITIFWQWITRK
jgi:hypothetical protein